VGHQDRGEKGQELLRAWAVLPTYNEAGNVARMLRAILSLGLDLDILVVDDDSPDGTAAIVEELARECPRVHVLRRTGERGLGTAYRAGFRHALEAGADAVLTLDCDFSHDPGVIPVLMESLCGADVVIGSRYVPGGRIENWSPYRKRLSAAANRFVRTLFRLPVRDCTSGYRWYRRQVLEAIPWERVRSQGYSFLVETLYWASQRAARVKEVPICFVDRKEGRSKMGMREAFQGIGHLVRLKLTLREPGGPR
jgi:dolichol-phosphate mannosyltransferase